MNDVVFQIAHCKFDRPLCWISFIIVKIIMKKIPESCLHPRLQWLVDHYIAPCWYKEDLYVVIH